MRNFEEFDFSPPAGLSLAIGVVHGDETLIKTYGEGIGEKTRFGIGSCTKAFTALVCSQLVEEGRLAWDDRVSKHVPEARLASPDLTLRDLLSHRSGLPRADELWHGKRLSRADFLAALATLKPSEPGFSYSNLMYGVVGLVLERITGQSWQDLVHQRIFAPLGMSASTCSPPSGGNVAAPGAATPYRFTQMGPAGAIYSSASDMVKWVQFQLSGSPLLREMHTPQIAIDHPDWPTGSHYGLGWMVSSHEGRPLLEHKGSIQGYTARVCLLPESGAGVVILTNTSVEGKALVTEIGDKLLQYL